MIIKHPRLIIKQHGTIKNYRYVGDVSVSHRRTIHRRCSKIFCAASHTVGDNKLCAIYLIFCLDLNHIMGSQLQWMVFELLGLLSAVNMKL